MYYMVKLLSVKLYRLMPQAVFFIIVALGIALLGFDLAEVIAQADI